MLELFAALSVGLLLPSLGILDLKSWPAQTCGHYFLLLLVRVINNHFTILLCLLHQGEGVYGDSFFLDLCSQMKTESIFKATVTIYILSFCLIFKI